MPFGTLIGTLYCFLQKNTLRIKSMIMLLCHSCVCISIHVYTSIPVLFKGLSLFSLSLSLSLSLSMIIIVIIIEMISLICKSAPYIAPWKRVLLISKTNSVKVCQQVCQMCAKGVPWRVPVSKLSHCAVVWYTGSDISELHKCQFVHAVVITCVLIFRHEWQS